MKLESFRGSAVVLGVERAVEFDGKKLTITFSKFDGHEGAPSAAPELDYEAEVQKVLAVLGSGDATTTPAKPLTNGVATTSTPKAAAAAPAAASKPAADPKPVEKPKAAAKAEPAPAKVEPKLKAVPPPEPEQEPAVGDEPAESVGFDLDGDLPAKLVEAARFRDVVIFLQDRGFRTEDHLIGALEKVRDRVPVLKGAPDLRGRLQTVLSMLATA